MRAIIALVLLGALVASSMAMTSRKHLKKLRDLQKVRGLQKVRDLQKLMDLQKVRGLVEGGEALQKIVDQFIVDVAAVEGLKADVKTNVVKAVDEFKVTLSDVVLQVGDVWVPGKFDKLARKRLLEELDVIRTDNADKVDALVEKIKNAGICQPEKNFTVGELAKMTKQEMIPLLATIFIATNNRFTDATDEVIADVLKYKVLSQDTFNCSEEVDVGNTMGELLRVISGDRVQLAEVVKTVNPVRSGKEKNQWQEDLIEENTDNCKDKLSVKIAFGQLLPTFAMFNLDSLVEKLETNQEQAVATELKEKLVAAACI